MSAHNELWADMNVLAQIVVVAMNVVLLVPTITVGWLLGDTTLPQPKHVPMPPPLVLSSCDNHSLQSSDCFIGP